MEIVNPAPANEPAPAKAPGYAFLTPPGESASEPRVSGMFVILAILIIGAAGVGGAVQSGKLSLNKYFSTSKPATQAKSSAAPAASVTPLKPGVFVVTAISLGQPSYAIINGKSRVEGDDVEAPGVTGWKVNRIMDGVVWLQNGKAFTPLPLTVQMPGIKPLNDQLHPLN